MSEDDLGGRPGYAYTRVHDEIRGLIAGGAYAPGALLPSVREITARWGVSTTTARRALHELVLGGYARAEGRRGHMCVGNPDRTPSDGAIGDASGSAGSASASAPGMMGRLVLRAPQTLPADAAMTIVDGHVSAVDVRREIPPPEVALALLVSPGERLVVRRRVFVDARGMPVQFRISYLPIEVADGTLLNRPEILEAPWPLALAVCTDRQPETALTQTTARHPTDVEAAALDLRADSAVLVRDDITFDSESNPLDFTRNVWPGDSTRLTGSYTILPA